MRYINQVAGNNDAWDHSSAGRAPALQAGGHRFEPCWSHFRERDLSQSELYERENVTATSSQDAQSATHSRKILWRDSSVG